MPVVITMLSPPGSRWKQNNRDKDDLRIWENQKYFGRGFWDNWESGFGIIGRFQKKVVGSRRSLVFGDGDGAGTSDLPHPPPHILPVSHT